ncbi:hypothetical protein CsSME_00055035 [Camellia sinensis var. sinensis]
MSGVTHTEEHRGREAATNLGKWAMRVKDMKPRDNCFLCDELHWARDCPKRKSLIAKLEEQEREEQSCMGSLQLLEAKPTASTQGDKGLMYVEDKVDGEATQVMVDIGASHHFINAEEAKRVGPNLDGGQGLMKVENTKAKSVEGLAQGVELHLGKWREEVKDCGMVLGRYVGLTPSTVIVESAPRVVSARGGFPVGRGTDKHGGRQGNVPLTKASGTSGGSMSCTKYNVAQSKPRRSKSRKKTTTSRMETRRGRRKHRWGRMSHPAESSRPTRRGRREHRWGRMSRPAKSLRQDTLQRGSLKKKRLVEWLGSSWKT